ncbi:MAG: class I SAM-dependent methyltransferase [Deltaproteobacteria bacterium]|nr:MAG: class I SAM-dependent methyltransferase [Deltaproteobacteria bacterium]
MSGDELYRDPLLYDLEYDDQVEDAVYYARIASQARGPVLELGCGTGRITLPMARAGARVTAVDQAAAMLERLSDRLVSETQDVRNRVEIVRANFLDLGFEQRFPLVVLPFNTLHHCHTHHDVLALLRGVRRALVPEGRFVLDCYLPDPSLYARDPNARYEERVFVHPHSGARLQSWEAGSYDALTQIHEVRYIYRHPEGQERTVTLRLRMFYPQELRALLDWGGFRIVHEAEDFEGRPLQAHSLKWVLVLEPR